ncbi:LysR family transcriptional regulator [Tsuneonella sp. HG094]
MIDRYLLRYFLAVIDRGNFTRAAEACNVSQPTLSVGIAKLEALVGTPLFNRTNRRVDTTPAGARLAVHARQIEAQFNAAERLGEADVPRRTYRLGVLATLPLDFVRAATADLAKLDTVRLELVEGRERELAERLAAGRLDAAITIVPLDDAQWQAVPLWTEGYSLALPESHPLAREAEIDAADLAAETMIARRHCELLSETSRHFTQRGVRPFFSAKTTRDQQALAYVAAGLGVTVMPDRFTAPGVVRVPLADFAHARTIGLVYRAGESPAEGLAAVLLSAATA